MRTIKRGDVYWCVFESDRKGNLQRGRRPVVVVSNNKANYFGGQLTVVPLTTKLNKKDKLPTHTFIEGAKPSLTLCEQVTCVSKAQLGDFIRECTAQELADINKALIIQLSL